MDSIPGWLGAIGALFVIAAALGSSVAVYRTNLQGTALKQSEATVDRLRGEIGDYKRREAELEADLRVEEERGTSARNRITVLEDLIIKRQDDDVIRAEIAAVKTAVDEVLLKEIKSIHAALLERYEG